MNLQNANAPHVVSVSGPYGVHDSLNRGIQSVSHELLPKHPLADALLKQPVGSDMAKLSFGQHVTFRLKSEIDLVTTSNSFGIHSSGLLRSVIEGKDETIDVADLLKSPLPHFSITIN